MSIYGGPLHSDNVLILYGSQSGQGSFASEYGPVGLVSVDITQEDDVRQFWGPGQALRQHVKGGMVQTPFNLSFEAIQSKEFIAQAIRTGSVLPFFSLAYGVADDGDLSDTLLWANEVRDCMIHALEIDCEAEGYLKGSVSGVGGLVKPAVGLSRLSHTGEPIFVYDCLLTRGGAAYEVRGFKVSLNNNCKVAGIVRGTARPSGEKRLWDYQTPGRVAVSGEITRNRDSGTTFGGDTIAAATDMVLTATTSAGTIVFTVDDVTLGSQQFQGEDDQTPTWRMPFTAKNLAVA